MSQLYNKSQEAYVKNAVINIPRLRMHIFLNVPENFKR